MTAEAAGCHRPTMTVPGDGRPGSCPPVSLPARWRPVRRLGVGGQAEVWLACDLELGEEVAVKVFRDELSEEARERLRREVRLGRALQHPNLVRMFELVEVEDRPAVVMEWVRGGSLGDPERPRPSAREVVAVARDTLSALAYLHERRVVHRDVKPSNLLLDEDGRVRLGDLGLVRQLDGEGGLTRTAVAVGTPVYMSPEQLRGEPAAPASDLYSLGATLYELITGRPPFEAASQYRVAEGHLRETPVDPRRRRPECPRWLGRFVMRLLEKRPEDRFQDAGAALRALEARRVGLSRRVWRSGARNAALGALVVLAVTAAAHLAWRGQPVVRVETQGSRVEGLDAAGRPVWHVDLASPVRQVERADLDGDGREETVVIGYGAGQDREGGDRRSDVVIVRNDGAVVASAHPEDLIPVWNVPFPKVLTPRAALLDVDGDGLPEVVLRCNQRNFYPSLLAVYWPKADLWEPLVLHSGWISDVVTVPSEGPGHLRFAAVNNRLGLAAVVGEIAVGAPGASKRNGERVWLSSPESSAPAVPGVHDWLRWVSYTLLGQAQETSGLEVGAAGGSTLTVTSVQQRLDRLGNPVPGPNAGRDLRQQRLRFLIDRMRFNSGADRPLDAGSIWSRYRAEAREYVPLLTEETYRVVLDEAVARALARAGDQSGAEGVLRRSVAAMDSEDARYRLANLLAVGGREQEALRLIEATFTDPRTPRAGYDFAHLLLRVGIRLRDESLVNSAAVRMSEWTDFGAAERLGLTAALWARADLWWDRVGAADAEARSYAFAPAGGALACLARWRLGRTRPGDAEAMERFVHENPDATWEGQAARAAALLGRGDAGGALVLLGQLDNALRLPARDDFSLLQLRNLVRALHAVGLEQEGRHEAAVTEARGLEGRLRSGLLPSILVHEVLAGAHRPTGPPPSRTDI